MTSPRDIFFTRYIQIQALKQRTSGLPVKVGETWSGTFNEGMKILRQHFLPKYKSMEGSLKEVAEKVGASSVTWKTMKIKPVLTWRGSAFDGLRSDVEVNGITSKGNAVQYRFMQGPSGYGGYRYFRYKNSALILLSANVGQDGSRDHMRPRDYFTGGRG